MLNPDIAELFDRVPLGTKVVVLPRQNPTGPEANQPIASTKKRTKAQNVAKEAHQKDRSHLTEPRQRKRTIFGLFGFNEN